MMIINLKDSEFLSKFKEEREDLEIELYIQIQVTYKFLILDKNNNQKIIIKMIKIKKNLLLKIINIISCFGVLQLKDINLHYII